MAHIAWQEGELRIVVTNEGDQILEEKDGADSMGMQRWKVVRKVGASYIEECKSYYLDHLINGLVRKDAEE